MTFTLPDYPVLFWITASVAVLLFGIAKAGFAGGISIIATPLVSLTIGVAEAAAILLPLIIIADWLALFYYRRDFDRRSIKVLMPGALLGIFAGALFFRSFMGKDNILRTGIGILALLFVLFQIAKRIIMGRLEKRHPRAIEGVLMGTVTGFTSTIAHAGGPPMAVYLLPQQFPKNVYVGTTALFFTITNVLKLIPYGMLGLLKVGNLWTIALLSPLCYVGVRLGVYLNRRFSDVWFMRLVYTILLLSGIQLVWSGIAGR
jgi:uncharacterized protein